MLASRFRDTQAQSIQCTRTPWQTRADQEILSSDCCTCPMAQGRGNGIHVEMITEEPGAGGGNPGGGPISGVDGEIDVP